DFKFDADYKTFIPYVRDLRVKGDQYISSFEALYDELNISELYADSLAFSPLLVDLGDGVKAALLEANLENYPGMFLTKWEGNSLAARFASYPIKEKPGGHTMFNSVVTERANCIAKVSGINSFPWRAVVVTTIDKDLANNDMIQKLASPNRIAD